MSASEDYGGPRGYEHLIEVFADPDNEEHDDMIQWLGIEASKGFDRTFFHPKHVIFHAHKKPKRR